MTSSPPLPDELAKRFEVLGTLGEGGFGSVLRCRDRRLNRIIALKLLHVSHSDGEIRARFLQEAQLTEQLKVSGLVQVHDAAITREGVPFIVYELVDGPCLDKWWQPHFGLKALVQVGARVARSLYGCHQAGVIHRDVKPANIVIGSDGKPVLIDLGIAKATDSGALQTATGVLLGTPAFMAPELWSGAKATAFSDQFALSASLGMLLLGGDHTVYGSGEIPTILAALQRSWQPPKFDGSPVSRVLRRALAPVPASRFPHCGAFAEALEQAVLLPDVPMIQEVTKGPDQAVTLSGTRAVASPLSTIPVPSLPSEPAAPRGSRLSWYGSAAAALLLLIVLGQVAWSEPAPPPVDPPGPSARAADRREQLVQAFDKFRQKYDVRLPEERASDWDLSPLRQIPLEKFRRVSGLAYWRKILEALPEALRDPEWTPEERVQMAAELSGFLLHLKAITKVFQSRLRKVSLDMTSRIANAGTFDELRNLYKAATQDLLDDWKLSPSDAVETHHLWVQLATHSDWTGDDFRQRTAIIAARGATTPRPLYGVAATFTFLRGRAFGRSAVPCQELQSLLEPLWGNVRRHSRENPSSLPVQFALNVVDLKKARGCPWLDGQIEDVLRDLKPLAPTEANREIVWYLRLALENNKPLPIPKEAPRFVPDPSGLFQALAKAQLGPIWDDCVPER